jgi:hypothetical protein
MNTYIITKTTDTTPLFAGQFNSFVECLETAVTQRVNLTSANLANKNLSNANIDDAIMPGANLTNTNLTGTNLSESDLTGANFTNASLYNTCLCYADLTNCNFAYTSFGATDIRRHTGTIAILKHVLLHFRLHQNPKHARVFLYSQ